MSKNTSIVLGDHFESFIAEQISKGRYASASEIVREGLRLVEEREQKVKQKYLLTTVDCSNLTAF